MISPETSIWLAAFAGAAVIGGMWIISNERRARLHEAVLKISRNSADWRVSDKAFELADEHIDRNLPSVCPILMSRKGGCTPQRLCEDVGIEARPYSSKNSISRDRTFARLASEALSGGVFAAHSSDEHCRDKVIDLAAICKLWIEAIELRELTGGDDV